VIFPALRNTIVRYGVTLATLLLFATFAFSQHYQQTNLVSDLPGVAARTDANLINAWGLARSATSPWWVNSAGASVSILYNTRCQRTAIGVRANRNRLQRYHRFRSRNWSSRAVHL
jgi:hypothetical protein